MKPKKSDYKSFEDFLDSDQAKDIVKRVLGECQKEGMFIKRRAKKDGVH